MKRENKNENENEIKYECKTIEDNISYEEGGLSNNHV